MKREKVKKSIYKKWWFWLIALIIVGSALSGGEDNETVADVGNEQALEAAAPVVEQPQEPETPVDVAVVKIGLPDTIADVSFTVNSVEETQEISSGNEFIENATTEGKFVVVDVTVKNDKKEALTKIQAISNCLPLKALSMIPTQMVKL